LQWLPQSFPINKHGMLVKMLKGYDSENTNIEQEIDQLKDK
jgi:hypothetical protein